MSRSIYFVYYYGSVVAQTLKPIYRTDTHFSFKEIHLKRSERKNPLELTRASYDLKVNNTNQNINQTKRGQERNHIIITCYFIDI